jgi:hypothetical protein
VEIARRPRFSQAPDGGSLTTVTDCREKAALFAGEIPISAGICIPQAKTPSDRWKMKIFDERFLSPAAWGIFRRLFRRVDRFRRPIAG